MFREKFCVDGFGGVSPEETDRRVSELLKGQP